MRVVLEEKDSRVIIDKGLTDKGIVYSIIQGKSVVEIPETMIDEFMDFLKFISNIDIK